MGPLDGMVMAGKGTPSEESVPLVCPECRSHETEQTTRGQIRLDGKPRRDTNRATCRACGITGTVADWELIEQLRTYMMLEAKDCFVRAALEKR